jgi:hypothetical protein
MRYQINIGQISKPDLVVIANRIPIAAHSTVDSPLPAGLGGIRLLRHGVQQLQSVG